MNKEMNRRIVEKWMRAGVSVTDPPDSTWIHASVSLSPRRGAAAERVPGGRDQHR